MSTSPRNTFFQPLLPYLKEARHTLGRYLLGQSLVSTGIGLSTWAGLALAGLPGAFFLGLLSGALSLVPVLGIGLAFVICLAVALFQQPLLGALGGVCAVFLVVQLLEGFVLSPLILGRSLGLHPLVALGAILGFSLLLGPLGLLLGLPLAAILLGWGRRFLKSPERTS